MGQTGWTPVAETNGWTPVRQAPAAVANVPRDARGMPAVTSETSEGEAHPLFQMLGPLAHPETFTDFARLLTLPVDSVKKAIAGALTLHASKNGLAAVKDAPAAVVRGAVNGAAAAGDAVHPDVIGAVSPRAGKVVEIAQRMRAARPPVAAPVAEAAPVASEAAPAATIPPTGSGASLPDQKALNEAALAVRRAAYQASRNAEATASPAASAAETAATVSKFRLSAPEAKDYIALIKQGKTRQQAMETIEAARAFAKRFGLETPTHAETTFPKGLRGKVPPS